MTENVDDADVGENGSALPNVVSLSDSNWTLEESDSSTLFTSTLEVEGVAPASDADACDE